MMTTGISLSVAMMTFFIDVNNTVTSSFMYVNNAVTWILNCSFLTIGDDGDGKKPLSVAVMTITFFVDMNIDIDFRVFL